MININACSPSVNKTFTHVHLSAAMRANFNFIQAHKDARKRSDNERRLETAVEVRGS